MIAPAMEFQFNSSWPSPSPPANTPSTEASPHVTLLNQMGRHIIHLVWFFAVATQIFGK